jgi:hypothetical protein
LISFSPEGTGFTVANVEGNMEKLKNTLSKVRNVINASISTKVAADIFHMKDNDYLLLVDYYSKWLEVHKPDNLSSKNTIAYVKSTFSRNGVPDIFFTDVSTCVAFPLAFYEYPVCCVR